MPLTLRNELDVFKAIARLEVDNLVEHVPAGFDRAKYLALLKEEFYKRLYVERASEDGIARAIFSTNEMTCVVGTRGSGKTTTILRLLERDAPVGCGFLRIDFNSLVQQYPRLKQSAGLSLDEVEAILQDAISTRFRSKFFHATAVTLASGESPRAQLGRLARDLLVLTPEETGSDALHDFAHEHLESIRQIMRNVGEDESSPDAIRKFVNTAGIAALDEYIDTKVIPSLGVLHYAWGLIHLQRFTRFFVFLDNVDRLPNEFQAAYLEIANDIQENVASFAKCIVAIREENVFRPNPESSRSQANLIEFARIRTDGAFQRNAERLAPMDKNLMTRILQKRLALVRDYRDRLIPNSDRVDYEKRVELMIEISAMIEDTYVEEEFDQLTNGSCRLMLQAHMSFLPYVMQNKVFPIAPLMKNRDLRSLFYAWLMEDAKSLNLHIHNLVDLHRQRRADTPACFLDHLVLAYLANAKTNQDPGRAYHYTQAGRVFDALVELGHHESDVKEAIFRLFKLRDVDGHMVEMRARRLVPIQTAMAIHREDQVWITQRGAEAVSNTAYRYHFVLEGLSRAAKPPIDLKTRSLTEQVASLLWFLCEVMNLHLGGLDEVRTKYASKHGTNWLSTYRRLFVVRNFQAKLLLENHASHLRSLGEGEYAEQYERLKRRFEAELEALLRNEPCRRISLDGLTVALEDVPDEVLNGVAPR